MATVEHLFGGVLHALKRGGLWWSLAISIGAAALSFGLATLVVVRWPTDRFKGEGPTQAGPARHVILRALGFVGRNLAGGVLIILGLLMSVPGVPGQGLLTMLIGVTLVSFPGKRRLERRLVQIPALLRLINRLRARFARSPLVFD